MATLLKNFFKGLMYIFVLPLLIVVLAIYSVVGIVLFIYICIKGFILYFTGRNIFGDLPEDLRAREILEAQNKTIDPHSNPAPAIENVSNPTPTQPNTSQYTAYYNPTDINYNYPPNNGNNTDNNEEGGDDHVS